ncbi:MAG: hypothetical protein HFACDABA_03126 [Anaerolineales bacterium]|nr:hypothetical protein [Anaerolineales bacterium]
MTRLKNWLPACAMMALIFTASSIPGGALPDFEEFDFSIKKLGHAIGYALLSVSYARGLGQRPRLAWLLAILFAITDEFHQSFTPGRSPSVWDVLVYDNLGATIGLLIFKKITKPKQKDSASAPPFANSQ